MEESAEYMQIMGRPHNRFHQCECGRMHCCYTDQLIHISVRDMNRLAWIRYLAGVLLGALTTYLIMQS